jgi:hypothetical protein
VEGQVGQVFSRILKLQWLWRNCSARIFDVVGLSRRERALWTIASFCLPVLLLLSMLFTVNGFTARDKYILFILMMMIVPLAGFLSLKPTRAVSLLISDRSLDSFLCLNLICVILVTPWLASAKFGEPLSPTIWRILAALYLFGAAALAAFNVRFELPPGSQRGLGVANRALIAVTPLAFVAAAVFPVNWMIGFNPRAAWFGAALAVVACSIWRASSVSWFASPPRAVWSIAVWAGPVAAAILMIDVQLDYDALHYTAYLAPSAAVAAGRIPLLDVFCQYGQPYLLYNAAFLVLPATFHSAALVTATTNVLYTVCVIAILRKAVRSHVLFLLLGIALPIAFWLLFATNRTPSLGGMRYLAVAFLAAVLTYMPARRCFSPLSIVAMAICWLWSFEAAIYGTVVYVAFALAVGATVTGGVAGLARHFLRFLAFLLAAFGLLALGVVALYLISTGQVPRYDLYVSQVLAYVGPDPFMEYNFFRQGFFAWAPILVGFFMIPCLIVRACVVKAETNRLPQITIIWALCIVVSVYCLLSTQPLYILLALMPLFLLLVIALDLAFEHGPHPVRASQLGLTPVFVLLLALLTGAAGFNFLMPPSYAAGPTSILSELYHNRRLVPRDFLARLGQICHEGKDLEVGNACSGDTPMPNAHYREFEGLIQKWQGDQPTIFAFHPSDALMNASLNKAHRLPVTFAYVDGFSPALFEYIVGRSRRIVVHDLRAGETLILTKDLLSLDELQWALLNIIATSWELKRIDRSEHFAVFRLEDAGSARSSLSLVLPDRPIELRNSL